jgi:hypothetical protein
MCKLGDKVFLRACRVGEPGTVIRAERGRLTVFWKDMDHWSRHPAAALELAEQIHEPQPLPASLARCLECEENTHNG